MLIGVERCLAFGHLTNGAFLSKPGIEMHTRESLEMLSELMTRVSRNQVINGLYEIPWKNTREIGNVNIEMPGNRCSADRFIQTQLEVQVLKARRSA